MAYRPDGGTVLPARWGRGSPLARVEVGGVALPATPLCLPPAPVGTGILLGAHCLSCWLVHQVSSGFGARMLSA